MVQHDRKQKGLYETKANLEPAQPILMEENIKKIRPETAKIISHTDRINEL